MSAAYKQRKQAARNEERAALWLAQYPRFAGSMSSNMSSASPSGSASLGRGARSFQYLNKSRSGVY